ncbi:MAG: hypothetical protein L0387_32915 [Acidobacteria bacterium]|nr:hypothetical protein [Acidobacteriota bacterium]
MTLHNVWGHNEVFRLAFGLGGLIGIWAARYPSLRKIAAPPILLSWFSVITGHSVIDLFNDFVSIQKDFDAGWQRLSELTEMLIGIAGFLYMHLNSRMFAGKRPGPIDIVSLPRRGSP